MKRSMFAMLMVVVFIGMTGCVNHEGRRSLSCIGGNGCTAEGCQTGCDAGATCAPTCDPACGEEIVDPGDPGRTRHCGFFKGLFCHEKRERPARGQEVAPAGPPSGTVTYPYYTTRGPRDFLAKNPGSIGP